MKQVLASRSVNITELKRSPSAILEQADSEPVAVLKHNRPAAYLLSPADYESILEWLNADLRQAIHEGIASGPPIAADRLFDEMNARYAEPSNKPHRQAPEFTAAITFSPQSRQDLLDIGDCTAKGSRATARALLSKVIEQYKRISIGPLGYPDRDDLAPGLRMAAVGRYVSFFRVSNGEVQIQRVLQGASSLTAVRGSGRKPR